MMGYVIEGNPILLKEDAQKNREIIKRLKKQLEIIRAEKQSLGASWEGDASYVYQIDFQSKIQFFSDSIDYLIKVVDYEETASMEYINAEKKISALVGNMYKS